MKRNDNIDILRGIGIFSIILIHVNSWFLNDKAAFFIWNFGQFAVPVFVFCSTYLFFVKRQMYLDEGFWGYYGKRLKRLLAPYYLYLLFFFGIFLVKNPKSLSLDFLLRHATLTAPGKEVDWAILLFVYMSVLLFPLVLLWRKFRPFLFIYSFLALSSSLLLLSFNWPFNYKTIMWLPWSLVILFSWYFARFEERKYFYPLTILWTGLLFISLYFLKDFLGNSFEFFRNKYPPNLYYLSYGMFASSLVYYLADKKLFNFIHKSIHFLSANSYNIFFIHLWLIIAFTQFMNIKIFSWWQFFAIILGLTILVQSAILKIRSQRFSML